jgi:hypothetical protein
MIDCDHQTLLRRLTELDERLMDLYDLRVVDGDPAEVEASIFAEQLEIDRLLGNNLPLLAW